MSKFNREQALGEIVAIMPGAGDIFNEYSIDFYFEGDRPLVEAVDEKGLDVEEILERLETRYDTLEETNKINYISMSPKEITDNLIEKYHNYLIHCVEEINELSERVIQGNRPSHSNYFEVHEKLYELKIKLQEYVEYRELVLFPLLNRYYDSPGSLLLEKIEEEVTKLKDEYLYIKTIYEELIDISRDNSMPQNELNAYRVIFKKINDIREKQAFQAHVINNIILKKIVDN